MDSEKLCAGQCPVARALARAGDTWSMLILRDAGRGLTRYDQFRANLGIAPNILASRLKSLTAAGLLEKRRYSDRPVRHEYVLSDSGRDFLPVLLALGAWGARHFGEGGVAHHVDAATGARVRPVVVDAGTGAPIGSRPLRLVPPGEEGGARRGWLLD
ncbi:winged helix-turn-helix transcriptional regulator [Sphingomonas canadensis]|uniref:Winged helix-turn-helix transcriptional regulator n=1 Tax=Sphingomonas canadensis TaxID=1219257 RepID=A0ABW3HAT8_9SPHN|nr:helix-turn-helix domain-containing protein [Sphingomonas canadensis]MCW3836124.1 helix-turn-helix transcriptional regulator [Sphingomonas canadensis]